MLSEKIDVSSVDQLIDQTVPVVTDHPFIDESTDETPKDSTRQGQRSKPANKGNSSRGGNWRKRRRPDSKKR